METKPIVPVSHRINAIALWLGLAASLAGIYGAWSSVHDDLVKDRAAAVQEAAARQQRIDQLDQRLDAIERHLKFLDDGLPAERQRIAAEIFAELRRTAVPGLAPDTAPVEAMREMRPKAKAAAARKEPK
jgi:cell division protein FtsB